MQYMLESPPIGCPDIWLPVRLPSPTLREAFTSANMVDKYYHGVFSCVGGIERLTTHLVGDSNTSLIDMMNSTSKSSKLQDLQSTISLLKDIAKKKSEKYYPDTGPSLTQQMALDKLLKQTPSAEDDFDIFLS